MIYQDVINMRNNLDHVNLLEGADPKFIYAVSKNKAKLDSIIKILDKMKAPSDEINEFWQKLDEINKAHAEQDDSGTVKYATAMVNGKPQKAYLKVIGEGNPDSKYTKAVDVLKKKYQKDIDKYEEAVKKYNKHLDNDLPEDEYRIFWIDFEIIPKGLHPKGMDGCFPFVRDVEQEEDKTKDVMAKDVKTKEEKKE